MGKQARGSNTIGGGGGEGRRRRLIHDNIRKCAIRKAVLPKAFGMKMD
jgi:hypothetical protein